MSSRDVEFRLLQLVVSAVADERVTVALLHWDGAQLRFASNPSRLPAKLGPGGEAVRATIRALRNQVVHARGQGLLDLGVDLVHEVREGRGAMLSWSPLRRGRTSSSEAHFLRLAQELELRVPHIEGAVSNDRPPTLASTLVSFGERLRDSATSPDRIRVREVVMGLREYESPVSWLNHVWHHSFPLNLHRDDPDGIVRRVEMVLGRIDVSIPTGATGVVVAAHPPLPQFADALERIAEFVQASHGDRIQLVRAPLAKAHAPTLDALEVRIRADVARTTSFTSQGRQ